MFFSSHIRPLGFHTDPCHNARLMRRTSRVRFRASSAGHSSQNQARPSVPVTDRKVCSQCGVDGLAFMLTLTSSYYASAYTTYRGSGKAQFPGVKGCIWGKMENSDAR